MKRKMVTRTIEVTEIRCIIEDQVGHCSTRSVDIPGKHKNRLAVINALRNKLVYGCTLKEVLYTKRKMIRCRMPLDAFYSCSSHEELD